MQVMFHKVKQNDKWAKHFNGLYLGRVPRINDGVWKINPSIIVKNYEQQIPLSMHLVDKHSLKSTWDPVYDGYQIE